MPVNTFIGCDPATDIDTKWSDFSVIMVIAIDTNRDVLFSQTGGSTSDPDVEIDGYLKVDG